MIIEYQHLDTEASLKNKAFKEGSLYFCADSDHIYMDPIGGSERIMISGDVIALDLDSERSSIVPMNGKLYMVIETSIMYFYYNNSWIVIGGVSTGGGDDSGGSSYDDSAVQSHMNNSNIHVTSAERTNWNAANTHISDTTKHITSTERTNWNAANTHISDDVKHITSAERTKWNAANTHANTTHAPSSAEVNQNAYSNFKVGTVTVAANGKTATLTLYGTNVTLQGDNSTKAITISLTKENVVAALGYTPLETAPSVTKSEIISALGYTPATSVTVDTALSSSSTNPVQNKVVNTAINNLQTALNNKFSYGATDLVAGSSTLATGNIYLYYEVV